MFKLANVVFASVMLAQAIALPNPNSAPSGLPQLARFENDPGLPAVGIDPIDLYLDIYWQAMTLHETEASSSEDLPMLVPNSPPNAAGFSDAGVINAGEGPSAMTTVYDDSTIANFTLGPFFYGCVAATRETIASVPVTCNIVLTGYSSSGKQVAQQSFPFTADGLVQQMVEATPKGFEQVQTITFEIPDGTVGNATTEGFIDSVNYTVFSK